MRRAYDYWQNQPGCYPNVVLHSAQKHHAEHCRQVPKLQRKAFSQHRLTVSRLLNNATTNTTYQSSRNNMFCGYSPQPPSRVITSTPIVSAVDRPSVSLGSYYCLAISPAPTQIEPHVTLPCLCNCFRALALSQLRHSNTTHRQSEQVATITPLTTAVNCTAIKMRLSPVEDSKVLIQHLLKLHKTYTCL